MNPHAEDRSASAPVDTPVDASVSDPVAAALARLEASRSGLRQIMIPPKRAARRREPRPAHPAGAQEASGGEGLASLLPESLRQSVDGAMEWLRRHPVSALMVDGVQSWWQRHPLRHAASMAGEEVASVAAPLIRRHPVASVGLAAAAGALVVVGRPWRWRVFGGHERPLSRRMMRWVSSQIPLQAALGAVVALLMDQARQAAAQAAAHPPAAAAPGNPAAAAPSRAEPAPAASAAPAAEPVPAGQL